VSGWTLDHVWFWTRDMERSVTFYRDVVGLTPRSRYGDEWAEFEAGTARLALHGAGEGRDLPHGGTAVFRVDDLDEARFALELKGVTFDEHVGEVEGRARFASFEDPDGNTLQIIEYFGEH
jgi:catechol 2,3-dioxygenase-like lactoylglutathione lyase family enzyme